MKQIINIIVKMLAYPTVFWEDIKKNESSSISLMISYGLKLIALPSLALFLGYIFAGQNIGNSFSSAITLYILTLIGVFLITFVSNLFAPNFGIEKDFKQLLKVILFAHIPYWVASVLFIFSSLWIVVIIASFYSLYLINLGLPKLVHIPQDKQAGFIVTTIIVTLIIFTIIYAIAISPNSIPDTLHDMNEHAVNEVSKTTKSFKDLLKPPTQQ